MSFPAEGVESAIKNSIEDVRLFLDSRHPGHYAVYNLSKRSYRPSRFHNRVSYSDFSANVCEPMHPCSYHICCCCCWRHFRLVKSMIVPLNRCQSVAGRWGGPPTWGTSTASARICTSGLNRTRGTSALCTVWWETLFSKLLLTSDRHKNHAQRQVNTQSYCQKTANYCTVTGYRMLIVG